MKKIKWILFVLTLCGIFVSSCLENERVDEVYYQLRPIDSIDIGAINNVNEVTEIKTYYTRTSSCEEFFDWDYFAWDFNRNVAIVTAKIENDSCTAVSEREYSTLLFRPIKSGEYNFKFWKGDDQDGNPVYIERKILIQ